MSSGTAYVFSRNGQCNFTGVPHVNSTDPTHVGFGFEVAPDEYVFGSLEDGAGWAVIAPRFDNGFWMTTGSKEQMLATFKEPAASGFHGTLHGSAVPPYNSYKMISVDVVRVCDTVSYAEDLYGVGYDIVTNNCLDAVYNTLITYGVTFPTDVDPLSYWCPSGASPNSFFAALTGDGWSGEQSLLDSTGSPVLAVSCPTTVTSSCVASQTTPPPGGSSLATIPVITGTGPSQCMLCWINTYFIDLNDSTLSYCNPPQLDYYVPAKYLIQYFCDPSVATIEPFESMCTAACINPCQQYSLDAWIQTQGMAVQATWDNDFCGALCTTLATTGDCPVSQSQWSNLCNGSCPGADEGCSDGCGI